MSDDLDKLDAALASQIGDDVAVIFNHESLFKRSREAIAALRSRAEADAAEIAALQARAEAAEAALARAYEMGRDDAAKRCAIFAEKYKQQGLGDFTAFEIANEAIRAIRVPDNLTKLWGGKP